MSAQNFDFILGWWQVHNRRRSNDDRGSAAEWESFDSLVHGTSIMGGRGILDQYTFPQFPRRGLSHGMCLRLRDASDDSWRIWWMSTNQGADVGEPVLGRFVNGEGHFAGQERIGGKLVQVRTLYFDISGEGFEWEQLFSLDGGTTFDMTWAMSFSRLR